MRIGYVALATAPRVKTGYSTTLPDATLVTTHETVFDDPSRAVVIVGSDQAFEVQCDMKKPYHLLALVGMFVGVVPAISQTYPSRSITMIVPFAAGGPMDVIARVMADALPASLGQTVVVENIVGAGAALALAK